jgi:hypothetical protein
MTTTTNRGYSTPATGSQSGIWGSDDVNPNFTAIDKNLGAVASVALSGSTYPLSSSEYVCGTIKFSGVLSQNITVTFPTVAGWWTIINNCTGNFYVRLSCSSGGLKICPPPGEAIDVGFDATDAFYRNLPQQIGDYKDYAGASVPVWISGCSVPPYLLCDGSTYSAVTYPFLNTILGTTTLPDSQARVRIPLGGSTGRVTTAGSGIDGTTRFSAGGAQNVTLTGAQSGQKAISAAPVTITDPGHTHTGATTSGSTTYQTGTGAQNAATGSSTTGITAAFTLAASDAASAHNSMPPTYVGGITMIRAA